MKKLIVMAMVVGMLGMVAGKVAASTDTGYINLLVTPVVTIDLDVSPTYYDFGSVSLTQSDASTSALVLRNVGSVGFTVEKAVWDDDEWDITASSTTQGGFDLWAMTQDGQPVVGNYNNATNHRFSQSATGDASYSNLYNEDDTGQEDMDPSDQENLWFRIDMPATVANTNQQTIQVRLRATNK